MITTLLLSLVTRVRMDPLDHVWIDSPVEALESCGEKEVCCLDFADSKVRGSSIMYQVCKLWVWHFLLGVSIAGLIVGSGLVRV